MKKVQLITDGACLGNPGPGGWACILRFGQLDKEMWGAEPQTTNNRMELTAAVRGLAALKDHLGKEMVTAAVKRKAVGHLHIGFSCKASSPAFWSVTSIFAGALDEDTGSLFVNPTKRPRLRTSRRSVPRPRSRRPG